MHDAVVGLIKAVAPGGIHPRGYEHMVTAVMASLMLAQEQEALDVRWQSIGGGRRRLVPDAEYTTEEKFEADENIREIVASRTAPSVQAWDPRSALLATGKTFATKKAYHDHLKRHGLVETGGSENFTDRRATTHEERIREIAKQAIAEAAAEVRGDRPQAPPAGMITKSSAPVLRQNRAAVDEADDDDGSAESARDANETLGGFDVLTGNVDRYGQPLLSIDDIQKDAMAHILQKTRDRLEG